MDPLPAKVANSQVLREDWLPSTEGRWTVLLEQGTVDDFFPWLL